MLTALSLSLGLVLSGGGSMRMPLRTSPSSRSAAADISMSTRGIVITGGAAGVGYAYADEFMQRGHWVVICDIKNPEDAVKTLRETRGRPRQS